MTRLKEIRAAEKASHEEIYSTAGLFQPGSWLAKPVTTVMELLPMLDGKPHLRVLDLGCGVGRNSIPVAEKLQCPVDCVDILPMAIEKLLDNAQAYRVAPYVNGIVASIDDYAIGANRYDLVLAISALEHVASEACFTEKLAEIRDGIKPGGLVCLVVNSGVTEADKKAGEALSPQFEVNLPTEKLLALLESSFRGWQVVKKTIVHQHYDIPRQNGLAELNTDVVTFVAQKRR